MACFSAASSATSCCTVALRCSSLVVVRTIRDSVIETASAAGSLAAAVSPSSAATMSAEAPPA